MASYDSESRVGHVQAIGIVQDPHVFTVDWRAVECNIWVDTGTGHFNWYSKPGFVFAPAKHVDYCLPQLFAEYFPNMEARAVEAG